MRAAHMPAPQSVAIIARKRRFVYCFFLKYKEKFERFQKFTLKGQTFKMKREFAGIEIDLCRMNENIEWIACKE